MICPCRKVLIVDDEPFNLMPLEEILLQMHIKVDKAYDGEEAMQKIHLNQSKFLTCPDHKPY
jgi:PleD family two-component response regulator